jgi:serine/threonine protein kinase
MNAKKNAQDALQKNNTLGIEGLSTHPNAGDKHVNVDLPIEFGRYRLLKMLGEGGMGAVYLAHDIELDRQVALKLPHFTGNRSRDSSERFRREARLAATLNHPNICRIFDISEHDGRLFLTMEFVEGKSLNDIIKAKGAVDARTAAKLVSKLAAAVQFAHLKGIIHRDLKPANIMIKKDRDFVIMDFGLARRIEKEEAQLTATGAVLGTPAYMAPEQLRGDNKAVGAQSDVYSLGIILYELLTGQRPFQGTLPQIYAQVLNADSVSPSTLKPGMDTELDAICRQATAASVKQRYRTAEEFAKALGGYLAGQSQTASDPLASVAEIASINAPVASCRPTSQKPKSALTTYRTPIAVGAMVGLAALVFAGAFLFRRSNTQTIDEPTAKVESTPPGTTPQTSTATPNTSAPIASNGSILIANTLETPIATSPQVQASNTSATPTANNAQPPGLLWSSPPSKIWWRCASYSPKGNYVAASAEDRENPKSEFATI